MDFEPCTQAALRTGLPARKNSLPPMRLSRTVQSHHGAQGWRFPGQRQWHAIQRSRETPADFEAFIAEGTPGGCLGYGVASPCGIQGLNPKITAFHVEFDTFHNAGDPISDPVYDDHIGILLNGNAADHKVVTEIANLEDFQWHDVQIDVNGTSVRVVYDGIEKVVQKVDGLDFRGGYIVFTGSTGWATNHHRFDKLQILHQCK